MPSPFSSSAQFAARVLVPLLSSLMSQGSTMKLNVVLSGEKSSAMFGARTACAYVPRNVTERTGAYTASTFHEFVLPTVL